MIVATDWKPLVKNSLRGFVTLQLQPSGLVLREASLHAQNGRWWVGLPARPVLAPDGKHKIGASGKRAYLPVVAFADRAASDRFQSAALEALTRLLGALPP